MDPDGLIPILTIVFALAALVLCWRLGVVFTDDREKERRTLLGFSDRVAGYCAAFIFVGVGFAYTCLTWLSFFGLLWLGAIVVLLLTMACMLLFSLGYAKGRPSRKDSLLSSALGSVVSAPGKLIFKALGLSSISAVTEEELLSMADDAEEQSIIDESQKEMIANIVEFDDVMAVDVMTHRTELISVDENTPIREVVRLAVEEGMSRLPVYRKTLDDIVGILHVKDLFALWDTPEKSDAPARDYMRKAMFVSEACRARELLIEFKIKHTQVAVVVDEYGGTSGLISMEDILEEIVGNIQDEFDNEEEDLMPDGVERFIAVGSADLEDVFDAFHLELPESTEDDPADFDTVGGMVADRLGRIPKSDEAACVEYGGLSFTVQEASERRILKVLCTRICSEQPQEEKE